MVQIGDMIAELRRDRNLHQKDLARLLNVSISTISHYESGVNFPDVRTVIDIADFFGVSVDFLLGRIRLRMDYNTFKRKVKLPDGSLTSADEVMVSFLQLSDQSQADIINLINLFKIRDDIRHANLKLPIGLFERTAEGSKVL